MALIFGHLIYSAIILFLWQRNRQLGHLIKSVATLSSARPTFDTLTLPPPPPLIAPEIPPDFCVNTQDASGIISNCFAPLANKTKEYTIEITNVYPSTEELWTIRAVVGMLLLSSIFLIYRGWTTRRLPPAESCSTCKLLTVVNGRLLHNNGKYRDASEALTLGLQWELQRTKDEYEEGSEEQRIRSSVRADQLKQESESRLKELLRQHVESMEQLDSSYSNKIQDLKRQLDESRHTSRIWEARVNNNPPETSSSTTVSTDLQAIRNQSFAQQANADVLANARERRLHDDNTRLRNTNASMQRDLNNIRTRFAELPEDNRRLSAENGSSRDQSDRKSQRIDETLSTIEQLRTENQRLSEQVVAPLRALQPQVDDVHQDEPFTRLELVRATEGTAAERDTYRVKLNADATPIDVPVVRQQEDPTTKPTMADAAREAEDGHQSDSEDEDAEDDSVIPDHHDSNDDEQGNPKLDTPGEIIDVEGNSNQDESESHEQQDDVTKNERQSGSRSPTPVAQIEGGSTTDQHHTTMDNALPTDDRELTSTASSGSSTPTRSSRLSQLSTSPRNPPATNNGSVVGQSITVGTTSTLLAGIESAVASAGTVRAASIETSGQSSEAASNTVNSPITPTPRVQLIPNLQRLYDEFSIRLPSWVNSIENVPPTFQVNRSPSARIWQYNRFEDRDYNKRRADYERRNDIQTHTQIVWEVQSTNSEGIQQHRPFFRRTGPGLDSPLQFSYDEYFRRFAPPPTAPRGPAGRTAASRPPPTRRPGLNVSRFARPTTSQNQGGPTSVPGLSSSVIGGESAFSFRAPVVPSSQNPSSATGEIFSVAALIDGRPPQVRFADSCTQ